MKCDVCGLDREDDKIAFWIRDCSSEQGSAEEKIHFCTTNLFCGKMAASYSLAELANNEHWKRMGKS